MTNLDTHHTGLLLPALDGANPLGFLAALGTLRCMSNEEPKGCVKMAWEVSGSQFCPRLFGVQGSADELVAQLASSLPSQAPSPWNLSKRLPFAAAALREAAQQTADAADVGNREAVDAVAAFGCEVLVDAKDQFVDTALRMVRSGDSSGQGLLHYAQQIRAKTTTDHLRHALFEDWEYTASGSSLRWDPSEAREYALLASDPSGDGALSVLGANRLALEAMPLFTTFAMGKKVATLGFHSFGAHREMTWPLWENPLPLSVIRSLLTLPELAANVPAAEEFKPRGIAIVFRSRLFKPNKYYTNFAPARAVMT